MQPEEFESPASAFGGQRSIQLSYGCTCLDPSRARFIARFVVGGKGDVYWLVRDPGNLLKLSRHTLADEKRDNPQSDAGDDDQPHPFG